MVTVCIVNQMAWYVTFREECRKLGKQKPKGDGVLLLDKVWNSCSHQLLGLAMTPKDLLLLNDI